MLVAYKKDLIYVLLTAVLIFIGFYFIDRLHTRRIAMKDSQIATLETSFNQLKAQKAISDAKAANTITIYVKEKAKTQEVIHTLPALPPVPTVPDGSDLDNCLVENQQLQAENSACGDAVKDLQEAKAAGDSEIQNLEESKSIQTGELAEVKEEVKTETTRKKFWRDAAIVQAGFIFLKFIWVVL